MSRKQRVLDYLLTFKGQWVDGPELANEKVGGSEGLRRLRELRIEATEYDLRIEMRNHPDPRRAVHQYRVVPLIDDKPPVRQMLAPMKSEPPKPPEYYPYDIARIRAIVSATPNVEIGPRGPRFQKRPPRAEFGLTVLCPVCAKRPASIKEFCERCNDFGVLPNIGIVPIAGGKANRSGKVSRARRRATPSLFNEL